MATTTKNQWSITKYQQDTHLLTWIEAFLVDRKVQGLSKGTLYFYQKKLKLFADFCEAQVITQISQITPNLLRAYMQGLVPPVSRSRSHGAIQARLFGGRLVYFMKRGRQND